MLKREELNRYVREVARLATVLRGEEVRPANQDAPVKGERFATVFIANVIEPEQPSDHNVRPIEGSNDVQEYVRNHAEILVSVQFFRADALCFAERLRGRIVMSSVLLKMQEFGLGYIKSGDVRDLSAAIDTHYEARAQVDLSFYYVSNEEDTVPTFGRFPVRVGIETIESTNEVQEP